MSDGHSASSLVAVGVTLVNKIRHRVELLLADSALYRTTIRYALLTSAVLLSLISLLMFEIYADASRALSDRLQSALVAQVTKLPNAVNGWPGEALGAGLSNRVERGADISEKPYADVWVVHSKFTDATRFEPLKISGLAPQPILDVNGIAHSLTDPEAFLFMHGTQRFRAMQALTFGSDSRLFLVRVALPTAQIDQLASTLIAKGAKAIPMVFLLSLLGSMLVARRLFLPIRQVIKAMERLHLDDRRNPLDNSSRYPEVRALSEGVNALLERVDKTLHKQASFATEAAHELRTPLAAQRSLGELALRGNPTQHELRETIIDLLEEGEHMQTFISNALLIARADAGLMPCAKVQIDPQDLINRCVHVMNPLAEVKRQTVVCKNLTGYRVVADASVLRQALMNLVHNAIRHTQEGSRIEVGARAQGDILTLYVKDNGPGFKLFEQGQLVKRAPPSVPASPARDIGLGLGLSIAEALVRSQGGVLDVSSSLTQGTLVQVNMRIARHPAFPADVRVEPDSEAGHSTLSATARPIQSSETLQEAR